jgi:hypothetical protein
MRSCTGHPRKAAAPFLNPCRVPIPSFTHALNSDLGEGGVRGCRVTLCTPTHPFVMVSPYEIYHQNSSIILPKLLIKFQPTNTICATAFPPISATWRMWSHRQLPTSISRWSSDAKINKCAHSIFSLILIMSTASAVCRRSGSRSGSVTPSVTVFVEVAFNIFSPGHHWQPPPHKALASTRRCGKGPPPVGDRTRDARPQNSRKHTKSRPLTLNKAR